MSLTLGEKLRQAREARGITISDVAEQTRIAPLYIESIEKDDYSPLPGGIFNKGFVKSFARQVGVDEQEALQDYAALAADQNNNIDDEPKTRRPEVLTDNGSSSNLPTIVIAVIILGLMTWGVLALVNYIQNSPAHPANTAGNANGNANSVSNISLPNANTATQTGLPANNLKIEIKAIKSAVSLSSTVDAEKKPETLLKPEQTVVIEPKESLRLKYSQSKVKNVQMTINGKTISLPTGNGNRPIEFEIKQNEFQSIFESGQIGENFLIKKK